ncbi:hypothetical protein EMIHUDRAFT_250703 [Emiliania huxleyi CCMP1516]|uniref:F-box domain-containing protein n=2 Tax=Emiliania huxleyi TaxID=2903 RepID=A0A0D3HYQ4_EMIH1|nr:hypothetical protein EMIHUDRAFT_250703 [Emiliania huxleyi CCMP1516]EOD04139.1 hypothetical protein EMIHUDRAFT_250703 [Emiliania huxleyi CCMP1516]|eukprot:XP_005756568.1 hypothetical protein EMIHUDRAFT_250703 [Emiliania huxleyi CCMP1516]
MPTTFDDLSHDDLVAIGEALPPLTGRWRLRGTCRRVRAVFNDPIAGLLLPPPTLITEAVTRGPTQAEVSKYGPAGVSWPETAKLISIQWAKGIQPAQAPEEVGSYPVGVTIWRSLREPQLRRVLRQVRSLAEGSERSPEWRVQVPTRPYEPARFDIFFKIAWEALPKLAERLMTKELRMSCESEGARVNAALDEAMRDYESSATKTVHVLRQLERLLIHARLSEVRTEVLGRVLATKRRVLVERLKHHLAALQEEAAAEARRGPLALLIARCDALRETVEECRALADDGAMLDYQLHAGEPIDFEDFELDADVTRLRAALHLRARRLESAADLRQQAERISLLSQQLANGLALHEREFEDDSGADGGLLEPLKSTEGFAGLVKTALLELGGIYEDDPAALALGAGGDVDND